MDDEQLERIYNDPGNPAGFAGVEQLWIEAKKLHKNIRKVDIENFLQRHRTYTLHRQKRIKFKRARTIPAGYCTDLQVDLADMQSLARNNHGYKYILVGIDLLSKRVFAEPIKSKKAKD